MSAYTIAADEVAAHAKTLVASTQDTVTVDRDCTTVTLIVLAVASGSTAPLYMTVDGSTASVGAAKAHVVPAIAGASITVEVPTSGDTVAKVISAGAHTYSIEGA